MTNGSAPEDDEGGGIRYPDWFLRNRTLIRRIAIGLSVSSSLLVAASVVMVVRQERAHDEARCPFVLVAERRDGVVVVRDEARSCTDGVSEHRWVLVATPSGEPVPFEVGRRRLASRMFEPAAYTCRVFAEDGKARVRVENRGAPPVTYREEVARTGDLRPTKAR